MRYTATRKFVGPATSLVVAITVLAGCASPTPAPIRQSTVPPPAATTPAAQQREQVHIVRPGDTLIGIARQYGQNLNDLVVWNELMDPNQLKVGQAIRIAPDAPVRSEAVAVVKPVEVQPVAPVNGTAVAPVKHEPRGGRQPYSDQAWAAVRPAALPPPATAEPAVPAVPQDSAWLWPANGQVIKAFEEVAGDGETPNKGIDIAGNPGDPVIAAARGKVVYSGSGLRGFGKLVIISHDDDYLTAYAHNQALLVKEGDEVQRGQRIAELGSTDADRPKLHFEIRRQGRPLDPLQLLPAR
ncbi:MAG TPA: peptidoglycan DD-metalloendopeptidase family protein [Rhodocyclaceae bacterium]|nr:peptidoglycan DD-metalloendopeptidase family protein [Rhodocyclaceae bacterium]